MNDANEPQTARVRLTWEGDNLAAFSLLLQQGVLVNAPVGVSIGTLVTEYLGIRRAYLDNRINSVFLDGKPVDDVDVATVQSGSTLALSASLPGFVGAALRKGGYYAPMRYGISHAQGGQGADQGVDLIKLKLYNMVCTEIGPVLLNSGIYVEALDLADFFSSRSSMFWNLCTGAEVDGNSVDAAQLSRKKWSGKGGLVFLTVSSGP